MWSCNINNFRKIPNGFLLHPKLSDLSTIENGDTPKMAKG